MSQNKLKALFFADLARSGLKKADAERLKLRLLDPKATARLGIVPARAAYKIPYHDPAGKNTGYFRLRFLTGFEPGKKTSRYWQPKDSLPQLFFPRTKKFDLAKVLADASEDLYFTEGEKKADRACLAGLSTVGLGGVWNFKSKRSGTPTGALPDLDLIEWKNRNIVIVFDSDAATNYKVQAAMQAFAREALSRQAKAFNVALPPGPGGEKVGLDDFLETRGAAAFKALPREPILSTLAGDLEQLNEELVVIEKPAGVWQLKNQVFLGREELQLLYGHLRVVTQTERGPRTEAVLKYWLEWKLKRRAPRLVFEPGQPEILEDGSINRWSRWGCEPVEGSTRPWDELLDYLFKGSPEARSWFEDWCAYPLQHPGTKLYSAVVLFSLAHGIGKSLLGQTLGKIYGEAFAELTQEQLTGAFNPWAAGKLLALGDEVTGVDRRRDADRLKNLITQESVTVNEKYQPQYTLPDLLNYFFTTNHPNAFSLEHGDRRFFVHEVRGGPLPQSFYDAYDAWKDGPGPSHLFHRLLRRKLDGFNPRAAPPWTEAKREMTDLGQSELEAFAWQLAEDPDAVLRLDGQSPDTRSLLSLKELLAYADPGGFRRSTTTALAHALRKAGHRRTRQVKLAIGLTHLWPVRDPERWLKASHAELKAEREKGAVKLTALEGGRKF